MNYHSYFSADPSAGPVQCCIIGTGGFGRSFLAQSLRIPLLETRVAVDLAAETAQEALLSVGVNAEAIAICSSAEEASAAWSRGLYIATADLSCVLGLPFAVAVEATGHPEAGARHCRLSIEAGKHVALVTKEVDSVVGPGLARRARTNARLVTPVDGDQPSLLIGLVTWAEVLGLEIIAAGKSSEYDFVYDPQARTLTSNGVVVPVDGFDQWMELDGRPVSTVINERARLAYQLPQRAVPDLCELTVVSNAIGFRADRPDLHAPIARITEVADVFSLRAEGGLLDAAGALDVFHCLRLPGEVSFAGGVFITVKCKDSETWKMLADKGHVVSRSGATAMLYIPRHLLGVEAATSILEVALRGVSSGAAEPKPVTDLVAFADRDLSAGTILTASGHHHKIEDVSGRMLPAQPLGADAPAPYYLAANRILRRGVSGGTLITVQDLELEEQSELLKLRRDQDHLLAS